MQFHRLDRSVIDTIWSSSTRLVEPYWEDAVHSLKGLPHVIDLRNLGLVAGFELEPRAGKATQRAFEAFVKCYDKGVLVRATGDIIALSPPLIIEKREIDQLFLTIAEVLKALD